MYKTVLILLLAISHNAWCTEITNTVPGTGTFAQTTKTLDINSDAATGFKLRLFLSTDGKTEDSTMTNKASLSRPISFTYDRMKTAIQTLGVDMAYDHIVYGTNDAVLSSATVTYTGTDQPDAMLCAKISGNGIKSMFCTPKTTLSLPYSCSADINDVSFDKIRPGGTATATLKTGLTSSTGSIKITGTALESDGTLYLDDNKTVSVTPDKENIDDTGAWILSGSNASAELTSKASTSASSGTFARSLTATITCE